MRNSTGYVCTVMADDPGLPKIIAAIKKQVKLANAHERVGELLDPKYVTFSWSGKQEVRKRQYVRVRGRLGKNSAHRDLYKVGSPLHRYSSQEIKLEHAERVDIYIAERRNYIPVK